MAINYKSYEFQLYDCISQAEKLVRGEDADEEVRHWKRSLRALRDSLESRKFRVAVVGEFNRGKTSFVNALMGKEILPAVCMPTTASINRITYSDTPSAYIVRKNGEIQPVQIAELADYVTKLSEESAEIAAQLDEAVVEYPSLFCRNGVDLIDTPGMNDEISMNQLTISRLESIDLAIVALDANMPFSMTECDFTLQLLESPQVCQIIVVITKIDTIPEKDRQRVVDYIVRRLKEGIGELLSKYDASDALLEKYHAIFDEPYVFPVSSIDALEALSRNDMDLYRESGFLKLNEELPQIILTSQNNNVILNVSRVLGQTLTQYRDWLIRKTDRNREQRALLGSLKSELAKACNRFAKVWASDMPEDIVPLPDVESEIPGIRRKFIDALGGMKELQISELQRVFMPVIKEQYLALNNRFRDAQNASLLAYREKVLEPGAEVLRKEVETLLSPFPALRAETEGKLDSLTDPFSPDHNAAKKNFYWVSSPIPDESRLKENWNVMPYVNQVIEASLRNYCYNRGKEIAEMLSAAKQQMVGVLSAFMTAIDGKVMEFLKKMPSEEGIARDIERTRELDELNTGIRERFLSELRG